MPHATSLGTARIENNKFRLVTVEENSMKSKRMAGPSRSKALFTFVGGVVLASPVLAQEQTTQELEEIVVTGLRGSLQQSM